MAPRWKGKTAEAKALSEPMSGIISQLQSSFIQSNSTGRLTGCNVLVAANPEQTELLNRGCFGLPIITTEKENQWYKLNLEEALYLYYVLGCIKIVGENMVVKSDEELWRYVITMRPDFPFLFKGYAHLRMKNWVVREGSQYGVDFVAYRHHPSLVHSEFAVLVLSAEEESKNDRLKSWSDYHCTLRLSGSVAKTLLLLYVGRNKNIHSIPSWSLELYCIEERTVTRWNPEQNREDQTSPRKEL